MHLFSKVKLPTPLTISYFSLKIIAFVLTTLRMRCHLLQYNSRRLNNDWRPVHVSDINTRSSACSKWLTRVSPITTPATSPKYSCMSSIYNLNNEGLITPPWSTPYVLWNNSPSSLFHFTRLLALENRLLSNWNSLPLKPCDRSLNRRACRLMKSNADLRST